MKQSGQEWVFFSIPCEQSTLTIASDSYYTRKSRPSRVYGCNRTCRSAHCQCGAVAYKVQSVVTWLYSGSFLSCTNSTNARTQVVSAAYNCVVTCSRVSCYLSRSTVPRMNNDVASWAHTRTHPRCEIITLSIFTLISLFPGPRMFCRVLVFLRFISRPLMATFFCC
jgi:hypothetical protein